MRHSLLDSRKISKLVFPTFSIINYIHYTIDVRLQPMPTGNAIKTRLPIEMANLLNKKYNKCN